ncbi:hypothetical protein [Nocardia sp. NPDC055049]
MDLLPPQVHAPVRAHMVGSPQDADPAQFGVVNRRRRHTVGEDFTFQWRHWNSDPRSTDFSHRHHDELCSTGPGILDEADRLRLRADAATRARPAPLPP